MEETIMARTKSSKSEEVLQGSLDLSQEGTAETLDSEGRSSGLLMSVKSGAQAAQAAASQIGPSVSSGLRTVAYRGVYSVAYGVTFGLLLAEKLIPVKGFVADAIQEGNSAAKLAFKAHEERKEAEQGDTLTA